MVHSPFAWPAWGTAEDRSLHPKLKREVYHKIPNFEGVNSEDPTLFLNCLQPPYPRTQTRTEHCLLSFFVFFNDGLQDRCFPPPMATSIKTPYNGRRLLPPPPHPPPHHLHHLLRHCFAGGRRRLVLVLSPQRIGSSQELPWQWWRGRFAVVRPLRRQVGRRRRRHVLSAKHLSLH